MAVVLVAVTVVGVANASVERRKITTGGALVMLDVATGRTVWKQPSTKPRLMQLAGTGSNLVLANDARCTDETSVEGKLVAFDATTGVRRWRAPEVPVATKTMVWARTANSDAASRGVIVTPGGRGSPKSTGLSARSGRQVWEIESEQFLGASDDLVFTSRPAQDRRLVVAHDRRSGAERWTFPDRASPAWTDTFDVVAADDGTVVVGNGNYLTRTVDRPGSATTFFVLDARTGKERANFGAADPTYSFSDFVLADDALVYAEGPSLVARELATGGTRWTHTFDVTQIPGGTYGVYARTTEGRRLVLAEVSGPSYRVVALDIDTGSVKWTNTPAFVRAGGPRYTVLGQPSSQRLVGVDSDTGTSLWQRTIPRNVGGRYATISTDLTGRHLAIGEVCDLG